MPKLQEQKWTRRRIVVTAGVLTLALSLIEGISPQSRARADDTAPGGLFKSTQGRVMDTRSGTSTGGYSTPMQANVWRTAQVGGLLGVPTSGVDAVQISVTTLTATATGSVDVSPGLATPIPQLVLDFGGAAGANTNTTIVKVASNGQIKVRSSAATDLLIDLQGYFTAGATGAGSYNSVTPTRVFATANGTNTPVKKMTSGTTQTVYIAGKSEVPAGAAAAFINVTVSDYSDKAGYIVPYAADRSRPVNSMYFPLGATTAHGATVPLSSDGAIKLYLFGPAEADVIVDVVGYFAASNGDDGRFIPGTAKITSTALSLASGQVATVPVAGVGGVPSLKTGVHAVALNVEAQPSATTGAYLKIWPAGDTRPGTSSINLPRTTGKVTNFLTTELGEDGSVSVYNSGPSTTTVSFLALGWFGATLPAPVTTDAFCLTPSYAGCEDGSAIGLSARPQLQATAYDPANRSLTYTFEIWTDDDHVDDSAQTLVSSGSSLSTQSGGLAAWQSGAPLDNDGAYAARVRSFNGYGYSEWSDWLYFEVRQGPAAPEVDVAAFPGGEWSPPKSSPSSISFRDPQLDGNTQPVKFVYSVDGGQEVSVSSSLETAPADGSQAAMIASASVPATTSTGRHTILARSVDSTGLQSTSTSYDFYIGSPPNSVTSVITRGDTSSVQVFFSNAVSNGAPTTSYTVNLLNSSDQSYVTSWTCESDCKKVLLTDLQYGNYQVDVIANSDAGSSAPTSSAVNVGSRPFGSVGNPTRTQCEADDGCDASVTVDSTESSPSEHEIQSFSVEGVPDIYSNTPEDDLPAYIKDAEATSAATGTTAVINPDSSVTYVDGNSGPADENVFTISQSGETPRDYFLFDGSFQNHTFTSRGSFKMGVRDVQINSGKAKTLALVEVTYRQKATTGRSSYVTLPLKLRYKKGGVYDLIADHVGCGMNLKGKVKDRVCEGYLYRDGLEDKQVSADYTNLTLHSAFDRTPNLLSQTPSLFLGSKYRPRPEHNSQVIKFPYISMYAYFPYITRNGIRSTTRKVRGWDMCYATNRFFVNFCKESDSGVDGVRYRR